MADARLITGTDVHFTISRRTRKDLAGIFRTYALEEYGFEFQRTEVLVRLHLREYVSRSEAKRLLIGLERFKEIVLDFEKVQTIGQGFADELFRVFSRLHPGITIRPERARGAVAAMVRHVVDNC